MLYCNIIEEDCANWEGFRTTLFVSGCNHHCKNCFNREAWDFNYGKEFTEDEQNEIIEDLKPEYITGLSLLGGEPFERTNQEGLVPLIKKVKEKYPNKKIWCYTGFTFDNQIIGEMIKKEGRKTTKEMLENIDYIVDGKFVEELKDPKLRFRGSSNQRIIDVKKSLRENRIVNWKEE